VATGEELCLHGVPLSEDCGLCDEDGPEARTMSRVELPSNIMAESPLNHVGRLPVVMAHDPSRVLGKATFVGNRLRIEFEAGVRWDNGAELGLAYALEKVSTRPGPVVAHRIDVVSIAVNWPPRRVGRTGDEQPRLAKLTDALHAAEYGHALAPAVADELLCRLAEFCEAVLEGKAHIPPRSEPWTRGAPAVKVCECKVPTLRNQCIGCGGGLSSERMVGSVPAVSIAMAMPAHVVRKGGQ
jgi:hypothetical protein